MIPPIPVGNALVTAAQAFATKAHGSINHKRKYTGDDYIVHPVEVASIVASRPHTPEMLAAAYLHDTVEDVPGITPAMITQQFGAKVAALVSDLTDISRLEDGNRLIRKGIDRAHTAMASIDAKTIKLADLISNSRSIMQHDPGFAVTYMREKKLLLDVLIGGDTVLHGIAKGIVDAYYAARPDKRTTPTP